MTKDFNEFLELLESEEFKSMQQSAIDTAAAKCNGVVNENNLLQVATDIAAMQSTNLIRLYHAWISANPE